MLSNKTILERPLLSKSLRTVARMVSVLRKIATNIRRVLEMPTSR